MTKQDKDLVQSCFTYGMLDSHYMEGILARVGSRLVNRYIKYLEKNYKVVHGVYTDMEGCTYNKLVKIKS